MNPNPHLSGYLQRLYRCIPLFLLLYLMSLVVMGIGDAPSITNWVLFIIDVLPQPFLPLLILTMIAALNRWVFWCIFAVVMALFTAELISWGLQGTRIWTETMLLVLQTNSQETSEFLSAPGITWGIVRAFLISGATIVGFIWVSDTFKQKYPQKVAKLRENANRPIFNSDLPNTLLDLAGIQTQSFDPRYSLLSDSVPLPHRMIEGLDYDAIKAKVGAVPLRYDNLP